MLKKITELYFNDDDKYALREVFINPEHIVSIREYEVNEIEKPSGLHPECKFSRMTFEKASTIYAVGTPEELMLKFFGKKSLLFG